MSLPTADTIAKYRKLLAQFNDPDGCIDDAEDLLQEIPTYLEFILAYHDTLADMAERLRGIQEDQEWH